MRQCEETFLAEMKISREIPLLPCVLSGALYSGYNELMNLALQLHSMRTSPKKNLQDVPDCS